MAFFGSVEVGEDVDEGSEIEDGEISGKGDEGDYDKQGGGGEFVVYAPEGLWMVGKGWSTHFFPEG